MSVEWIHFGLVVGIQFFILIIHATFEKELRILPQILWRGMLAGAFFGIVFDSIFGHFLGLYTYTLGFSLMFLAINGALSYGFFFANTLLMKRAHFFHFYFWSIFVGIVYEGTNFFFPVWTWTFASSAIEYIIVIVAGYSGLAFLIALTTRLCLGTPFHFVDYVLHKEHWS